MTDTLSQNRIVFTSVERKFTRFHTRGPFTMRVLFYSPRVNAQFVVQDLQEQIVRPDELSLF